MNTKNVRVRFAPSPTGALHIGGLRTALYNYLFARKNQGVFILRIEDTDQNRYVPGAEQYIIDALAWCSMQPDEGPEQGGDYGPYRQSERKSMYKQYVDQLVASGTAYYAFDTAEDLDAMRERMKAAGSSNPQYDHRTRSSMSNSLTLDAESTAQRIAAGDAYVVRLKVEPGQAVQIRDAIRGEVVFQSDELDDKVLMKSDGMPTYHLANIVDDHLMAITHVIRGEEWLPSTAHHVLLYRAFGWEETMPVFAHLPLILKPDGKGKLSKRDGQRLGIPVFPLSWVGETEEESFTGFREVGFDPAATCNFIAFLGWNPGTEQEIYDMESMIEAFSLERIQKAGARFDYDKARWYNQQYVLAKPEIQLVAEIKPFLKSNGSDYSDSYLAGVCALMKERVVFVKEIVEMGPYFFGPVKTYDEGMIRKKWHAEVVTPFSALVSALMETEDFTPQALESKAKAWLEAHEIGMGAILPLFRLALAGTMKGPGVFEMMVLFGKDKTRARIEQAIKDFNQIVAVSGQ